MQVDLVVESGDAWDVHHFASLIGYGAAAVYPWLALETIGAELRAEHRAGSGSLGRQKQDTAARAAVARGTARRPIVKQREQFINAAEKGLLKIMSKMGISTISSYRGAQIFEALGLADEVVDRCFAGTPSAIGGLGFERARRGHPGAARGGVPGPGRRRASREGRQAARLRPHPLPPRGRVPRLQPAGRASAARARPGNDDYEAYQQFSKLVHGRIADDAARPAGASSRRHADPARTRSSRSRRSAGASSARRCRSGRSRPRRTGRWPSR